MHVRRLISVVPMVCILAGHALPADEPVRNPAGMKRFSGVMNELFREPPSLEAAAKIRARKITAIAIHPTSRPFPLRKFTLDRSLNEYRPGNAAPLYDAAFRALRLQDFHLVAYEWDELPLEQLPLEKIERALRDAHFDESIPHLRNAASLRSCDWKIPTGHDPKELDDRLSHPSASQMRDLSRVLAQSCRFHMARRELDQAVERMQWMIAMARHVAQTPTTIHNLVGLATWGRLRLLIEESATLSEMPSLSWSLADLPGPIVDYRAVFAFECSAPPDGMFAQTRVALDRELGEAEYRKAMSMAPFLIDGLSGSSAQPLSDADDGVLKKLAAERRPRFCDYLRRWNYSRNELDAMSDRRLLLVYSHRLYEGFCDELIPWSATASAENARRSRPVLEKIRRASETGDEIIPWATVYLPTIDVLRNAELLVRRRFDALRIIEALRIYASENAGRLPTALDELAEFPVGTIDVLTGEKFDYRLLDGTAELRLPREYSGEEPEEHLYRITIAAKK